MTLTFDIWSFLFLVGAIQSLLLTIVFWNRRDDESQGNLFLGTLFLLFSCILVDHSLRVSELYKIVPMLLYTTDSLWALIGPILLVYTQRRLKINRQFKWMQLLHLLPFIIFTIIQSSLIFGHVELKVETLEKFVAGGSQFTLGVKLYIVILMLQVLVYLYVSIRTLKSYEKEYKEIMSDTILLNLSRLKSVLTFFTIYFGAELFISTIFNFMSNGNSWLQKWSLGVWVMFVYVVSYVVYNDPVRSYPRIKIDKKNTPPRAISDADLNALKAYMLSNRPYLNPELRLSDLANALELSPHHLSLILNNGVKKNFYEFINYYRVLEVKRRLEDPLFEHFTILGIAEKTGFKSKASFYRFFEKEFGSTPSNYLKRKGE